MRRTPSASGILDSPVCLPPQSIRALACSGTPVLGLALHFGMQRPAGLAAPVEIRSGRIRHSTRSHHYGFVRRIPAPRRFAACASNRSRRFGRARPASRRIHQADTQDTPERTVRVRLTHGFSAIAVRRKGPVEMRQIDRQLRHWRWQPGDDIQWDVHTFCRLWLWFLYRTKPGSAAPNTHVQSRPVRDLQE